MNQEPCKRPSVMLRSLLPAALLWLAGCTMALPLSAQQPSAIQMTQNEDEVRISTGTLEAVIRKQGYVSGVSAGTFLDKKTGSRDLGFGLDIVDWLLEPGSDQAYRHGLDPDLVYNIHDLFTGNIPKRSLEGPQICTQAKRLVLETTTGKDFVGVKTHFRYYQAAPGKKPGSEWTQTIIFPEGKRYFISSDRIDTVNSSDAMFLRIDMPGHIKHQHGDTFSEVYLSYYGRIPSSEFFTDFPPDQKFLYDRAQGKIPKYFIRAYHIRDPKTGREGPWLAGITLDPAVVYQAWCHERGYVCMIEEVGGRPVKPGDSFSAAYVVGFFDSIKQMQDVAQQYAGSTGLELNPAGWKTIRVMR